MLRFSASRNHSARPSRRETLDCVKSPATVSELGSALPGDSHFAVSILDPRTQGTSSITPHRRSISSRTTALSTFPRWIRGFHKHCRGARTFPHPALSLGSRIRIPRCLRQVKLQKAAAWRYKSALAVKEVRCESRFGITWVASNLPRAGNLQVHCRFATPLCQTS